MIQESPLDLRTSSYQYQLPESLIAHHPAARRDQARLLVMRGADRMEHRIFSDLPGYLEAGDCLVINDTRVIPARLHGKRAVTGGAVEFLLLGPTDEGNWRVLVKPGRKARPGDRLVFAGGRLEAEVLALEPDGSRIVAFDRAAELLTLLDQYGEMPLPPYIREKLEAPERYQTVYAREAGSAAAPTAGLHFTEALLEGIEARGVGLARLTLHVGLGTFRPVKEALITDHLMHRESFSLSGEAVATIQAAKAAGGRIFAVGTTACRVLESVARAQKGAGPLLRPCAGETDLFIYPGFPFRVVDGLITNFHLPGSTLLMLVSAFMGREPILAAYREAVERQYRFFSFGDAMLLLPGDDKEA